MKTLMYPIAPEDDFPETFCAIRPYDGERRFYTPEGERRNALLFRMHKEATEREGTIKSLTDNNVRLRIDNAMLRELVAEIYPYAKAYLQEWRVLGCIDSKSYDWYLRLLELGVEVTE